LPNCCSGDLISIRLLSVTGVFQPHSDHLRPGGTVLIVHSSVSGVQRTLDDLTAGGLDADIVVRRRGPLGPLLRERAEDLWATGALEPGSLEEEIVIVRGRRPAPT